MNKTRRRELTKISEELSALRDRLQSVTDDEQASLDNLPDGLRDGAKGGAMEETIDFLSSSVDEIDEVISKLDEARDFTAA